MKVVPAVDGEPQWLISASDNRPGLMTSKSETPRGKWGVSMSGVSPEDTPGPMVMALNLPAVR